MAFLVVVIASDFGNVLLLACFLFGGSGVGSESKGTVFLSVPLGSVWFPLLVFPCLLESLVSLLDPAGFIWGLIWGLALYEVWPWETTSDFCWAFLGWSSRKLRLIFRGRFPLGHRWSRWLLPWILVQVSALLAALIRSSQGISSLMLAIHSFIEGLRPL